MKKVVLLGDSIRHIGYGTVLPEILSGCFEVWQPDDNSRFVQYVLRQLFDCAGEIDSADIVHFNVGLWDVCDLFGDGTFTPVEVYADYVLRIAKILLGKGKTVIFSTTTPARSDHQFIRDEDVIRFNEAAVSALRGTGVIINDLFSTVMSDREKYIREDDRIHLTREGVDVVANQIADLLRSL